MNPRHLGPRSRGLSALTLALALVLVLAPCWTAAAAPAAPRLVETWSAWLASLLGPAGLGRVTGATGVVRDPDGGPLPGTGSSRDPDGDPLPGTGMTRDPGGDPAPSRIYAGTGMTRDPNGDPLPDSGTFRDPDGTPLPGGEDGGWADPNG